MLICAALMVHWVGECKVLDHFVLVVIYRLMWNIVFKYKYCFLFVFSVLVCFWMVYFIHFCFIYFLHAFFFPVSVMMEYCVHSLCFDRFFHFSCHIKLCCSPKSGLHNWLLKKNWEVSNFALAIKELPCTLH